MKVLVIGASGATGQQLVNQLVQIGHQVKIIVRSTANLPPQWESHSGISLIVASILEIEAGKMKSIISDCDGIASCLGHNLTFKGIFGDPKKLVTESIQKIHQAVLTNKPSNPMKLVLMNTAGNRNGNLNEKVSLSHRIVVQLLRWLLPPQADNEKAADYLRTEVSPNQTYMEWVAVRPDSLVDKELVTPYSVHPSQTRDPIFNAGKTSRINVAHFMADLLSNDRLWNQWKYQMPVIYNKAVK